MTPLNVNAPMPVLFNGPLPLMMPLKLTAWPLLSIVPAPARFTALVLVIGPVANSVPALKLKPPEPRLASLATLKKPPLMLVVPL